MRFCQAFQELIEKYKYDGLHKYQTYGTFQTSGMFQMFQTTQPPGFSTVVPIFPRQKVDHRHLNYASEKLTAIAYIVPAEEGRIYIIYICMSRRSVTGQFSPKTSEGTTKQEHDEPHDRVGLGRDTKHPAARKCA